MRISDWSSDVCSSDLVTNRVAFVTGAARGLGLATATRFLDDGWRVVMLDILDDELAQAAKNLGKPEMVLPLRADVSDPGMVRDAVQKVKTQFGRIDALVNNAGIAIFKPMLEVTLEDWRSEEHTSELQSLMRISYAVFCLKQKTKTTDNNTSK